jgi:putative phosphoesterase
MRLLIVSDLHANVAALERVSQEADAVVVLGDLVDYGPDPEAAIEWVRQHATYAIRGNHDEAVSRGTRTGAGERLASVAEETAAWTRSRLGEVDRAFLASLPLRAEFKFGGASFAAVHAAPSDPLYPYLPPDTPNHRWQAELSGVDAEWLLVGHTHLPFVGRFGSKTVVNPGSVGQPRDGLPMTSFAVWEDGDLSLVRRQYDIAEAVRHLEAAGLSSGARRRLSGVLQTARR